MRGTMFKSRKTEPMTSVDSLDANEAELEELGRKIDAMEEEETAHMLTQP